MPTVEQTTRKQFERIFDVDDWLLFKVMAELNLEQAVKLRKRDMAIAKKYRLVARNSRKRLLIGVGVELLLKSIYLKQGYSINKPKNREKVQFPFLARDACEMELVAHDTHSLGQLIEKLPHILPSTRDSKMLRGLRIAKVFRNKEGHGVTPSQEFDESNYSDIAASLAILYHDVFGQSLDVHFSMKANEVAVWSIRSN